MLSELQRQVASIRSKHIQPKSLHQGRPSLFLDSKEAALVDVSTVYEAAVVALNTLIQYESRFENFLDSLLHPSSIDTQRELKTKEENAILDEQITSLLSLLSLFAFHSEAHLVIEYLLRRYQIHELNVDPLLKSMIIAHDTKIFARIVQLCTIEGTKWAFLAGVKDSGSPLPRSILVQRIIKDASLLDTINETVQSAINISVPRENTFSGSDSSELVVKGTNQALTFFTILVLEVIERSNLTDALLRSFYLFVLEGLKFRNLRSGSVNSVVVEWRRASCMIVAQLAKKADLAKPLVKSLSTGLAEAFVQAHSDEGSRAASTSEVVLTMVVLAQQGKLNVTSMFLKKLVSSEVWQYFVETLKMLNESDDITGVLSVFCTALVRELSSSDSENEGFSASLLTPSSLSQALSDLLRAKLIDVLTIRHLLNKLIHLVTESGSSLDQAGGKKKALQEIFRVFSHSYALQFEVCLSEAMDNTTNQGLDVEVGFKVDGVVAVSQRKESLSGFLAETFAADNALPVQMSEEEGGRGLLLSLLSAIPHVRMKALQVYGEKTETDEITEDKTGLAEAVDQSLNDENKEIALVAWDSTILKKFVKALSKERVLETFQSVIEYWKLKLLEKPKDAGKVLKAIFTCLKDKKVMKVLIKESSSSTWVFKNILLCAFGGFNSFYRGFGVKKVKTSEPGEVEVKDHSKLFTSLQKLGCEAFYTFHSVIGLWKGLKSAEEISTKTMEIIVKTLIDEASNASKDKELPSWKLLTSIINNHHNYSQGEHSSEASHCLAVLKFLDVISTEIMKKTENRQTLGTNHKSAFLKLCCPLLLRGLNYVDDCVLHPTDAQELIRIFSTFLDNCNSVIPASTSGEKILSLAQYMAELKAPLLSEDIGSRVLLQLLQCTDVRVLGLLGKGLEAFFPEEKRLNLMLKIVFQSVDQNNETAEEATGEAPADLMTDVMDQLTGTHPDAHSVNPVIRIPPKVNVTAVKVLSSFFSVLAIGGVPLSETQVQLILGSLVAAVTTVGGDSELREASVVMLDRAILALEKVKDSPEVLEKVMRKEFEGFHPVKGKNKSLHEDLVGLFRLVSAFGKNVVGFEVDWALMGVNELSVDGQNLLLFLTVLSGWELPTFTTNLLISANDLGFNMIQPYLLHFLENIPKENIVNSEIKLLNTVFTGLKGGFLSNVGDKAKTQVADWVLEVLANEMQPGKLSTVVAEKVVVLIQSGVFTDLAEKKRILMFERLLALEKMGFSGIREALAELNVPMSLLLKTLEDELKDISSSLDSSVSPQTEKMITDDDDDENEEKGDSPVPMTGAAWFLRRFTSLLETLHPALLKIGEVGEEKAAFGAVAVLLFNALTMLNRPDLKFAMTVDYGKSLVIDVIISVFPVFQESLSFSKTPVKPTPSKKKSKNETYTCSTGTFETYTFSRIKTDIELLLNCVKTSRLAQTQITSLKLLQLLVSVDSGMAEFAVQELGEMLSSAVFMEGSGGSAGFSGDSKHSDLLEFTLKTVGYLLSTSSINQGSSQFIVQSLCKNFSSTSSSSTQRDRRERQSYLLRSVVQILGLQESLVPALVVVLTHVIQSTTSTLSWEEEESEGKENGNLILLSRGAHRKANKILKQSQAEELYQLVVELLLSLNDPSLQLLVFVQLLHAAKGFAKVVTGEDPSAESAGEASAEHSNASEITPVSVESILQYCVELENSEEDKMSDEVRAGFSAKLVGLLLRLVSDLLENREFSMGVAKFISSGGALGSDPRERGRFLEECFMEVTDEVLQLVTFSSIISGFDNSGVLSGNKRVEKKVKILLDEDFRLISMKEFGLQISTWCRSALQSLQRLMDAPSFIAILQELIAHEDVLVQQKAISLLAERLEVLADQKGKISSKHAEVNLYVDLNIHLRDVLEAFCSSLGNSPVSARRKLQDTNKCGLAIAASSCIEVLFRFLGRREAFAKEAGNTLTVITKLGNTLLSVFSTESEIENETENVVVQLMTLKLFNSIFPCFGTISSVLRAGALPQLPKYMEFVHTILENLQEILLVGNPDSEEIKPTKKTKKSAKDQTLDSSHFHLQSPRTGLIVTILSATADVTSSLSGFCHPYLPKLLPLIISLEPLLDMVSESAATHIRDAMDSCLSKIGSVIPTRLLIPIFLQITPSVLQLGRAEAARFADLLGEIWQQLSRNAVVEQLNTLSKLATLLLDYRRVFGVSQRDKEENESFKHNEVEIAICETVLELCLKLTENELKTFLNQLSDWRDIEFPASSDNNLLNTENEGNWRKHARPVMFYMLIEALTSKLQGLFTPCMALLWSNSAERLGFFSELAKGFLTSNEIVEGEKKKKRKKTEGVKELSVVSPGSAEWLEMLFLVEKILSVVKLGCEHSDVGFIDEQRYNQMMPMVTSLLPLRHAFPSDQAYTYFILSHVGPCLSALAVGVQKDTAWKPLNHQVLLCARDKRRVVRLIAVSVLNHMFHEVGDEYLLLLPESLPFLSELLEDTDSEIVSKTTKTIRYIEELSGEKLDDYLQ